MNSAVGLANQSIFFSQVMVTIIIPVLVETVGPSWMFIFFALITFIGSLYILFFIRNTTYYVDESGAKIGLNDKEKKQLYMPEEYRDKVL